MITQIRTLLALISTCVATIALAHGGATGVVKERMDSMKAMEVETKVLGAMVKAQEPFDPERVKAAAMLIADHAAQAPALFPEDSLHEPSEALPVIWSNWPEFEAKFRELENAAMILEHSTSSHKHMTSAFLPLAGICKSCHESFKQKR